MNFNGFISYSHAADGRLAPAVQRALHRLAKPWHRRRALWIFRDQTGLSVTPGLWSSIQQALDGSEWFVLLASPEAARSAWVNREIEYWISTKPADRILPVVTDGEWRWDPDAGDLSADSTAVPEALRGVFAEEPLFLDLRWARFGGRLDLRDSRFRDAIAELAAPMHGVSKDELESEDVRQHRRVRRVRRVAVAALALLTVVASGTGVLAGHNADRATEAAVEAQRQQQAAQVQRGNAERSAEEARRQEANARTQEENARTQEERARAATTERKQQEKRAREQQDAAEQAAAEAERQQKNARRQQELAKQSRKLAEQQQALAEEQRELAQQSTREASHQRKIAEQQQRLAEEAAAEAERQRRTARQQQRMAEEAAEDARRQKAIAQENQRKAEAAAEDARRQEANAAEQQRVSVGRRLINQAKATIDNDPVTALRMGIAAQRIQPGTESRGELAGLVASTRRLGTLGGDVRRVAYGPGGVVAVVNTDFKASLWNMADPANPVRLADVDGELFLGPPAFSPDGKTLTISGGWEFMPHLFDISDPAHPVLISTVPVQVGDWATFSPDGQTLGVVDVEGVWSLWDIADRARPALLTRQTKGFAAPLTFSPDGRSVVVPGAPGTVWDITDRTRPAEVGTLPGDWWRVSFNPVRNVLVTNDKAGSVAVWQMDDRTEPRKVFTTAAQPSAATFSGDGSMLATSDSDGTARLWDVTDDNPAHVLDLNDRSGDTLAMAFSPDGRTLATVGTVGTLSLWNVEAHGEPKAAGRAEGIPGKEVTAALTPDGRQMTTVHSDGTATLWNVSDPARPVRRGTVRAHETDISMAAVSPAGDMIAAGGLENAVSVQLTDISDPSAPKSLGRVYGRAPGSSMAFSPDGHLFATHFGPYTVALWDLTDPYRPGLLRILEGNDWVKSIAWSPDGRTVAVGTRRTVDLWDVSDPTKDPVRLATLKGHSDAVLAMAFSPDGRALATGSTDRTAAVWSIVGRPRRQAILTGGTSPVTAVAFSPDGRTLATGTGDDAVTVWDVAEPAGPIRVAAMRRSLVGLETLLFHPDGRTLTSSGRRAVLWDYSALNALRADPAAVACEVAGAGLDAQEWAAYVPEVPYQVTCAR